MIVVSLFYYPFNNQPFKVAILLLTKVHFVRHNSIYCGAQKYILSMTKVYIVIHGIQGASLFVYESLY